MLPEKIFEGFVHFSWYAIQILLNLNLEQTIVGVDLSWRIIKRLSLSLNYEGTFEDVNNYSRF